MSKLLFSLYCHKINVFHSSSSKFTFSQSCLDFSSIRVRPNRDKSIPKEFTETHYVPALASWDCGGELGQQVYPAEWSFQLWPRTMSIPQENVDGWTSITFEYSSPSWLCYTWKMCKSGQPGVAIKVKKGASCPEKARLESQVFKIGFRTTTLSWIISQP